MLSPGRRIEEPIGRDPNNRQRCRRRPARADRGVPDHVVRAVPRRLPGRRRHRHRAHPPDPVHLSSIGHPVVGDALYGGVHRRVPPQLRAVQTLDRPFLHASRLSFAHPGDGRRSNSARTARQSRRRGRAPAPRRRAPGLLTAPDRPKRRPKSVSDENVRGRSNRHNGVRTHRDRISSVRKPFRKERLKCRLQDGWGVRCARRSSYVWRPVVPPLRCDHGIGGGRRHRRAGSGRARCDRHRDPRALGNILRGRHAGGRSFRHPRHARRRSLQGDRGARRLRHPDQGRLVGHARDLDRRRVHAERRRRHRAGHGQAAPATRRSARSAPAPRPRSPAPSWRCCRPCPAASTTSPA